MDPPPGSSPEVSDTHVEETGPREVTLEERWDRLVTLIPLSGPSVFPNLRAAEG